MKILLLKPCVIISPEGYDENMRQWQALYEDQVRNAQVVVFSKCENTDPDIIRRVSDKVKELNPLAEIISNHYSRMEEGWWKDLLDIGASKNMGELENHEDSDISFAQVSVSKAGLHNVGELVTFLEDCLRGEFGKVARAKGTLWVDNEFLRFDLADRMYLITGSPDDNCQCVVIGRGLDEKKIRQRLSPSVKMLRL